VRIGQCRVKSFDPIAVSPLDNSRTLGPITVYRDHLRRASSGDKLHISTQLLRRTGPQQNHPGVVVLIEHVWCGKCALSCFDAAVHDHTPLCSPFGLIDACPFNH
jgi:hypothetical protein